jgi:hypothetical protein
VTQLTDVARHSTDPLLLGLAVKLPDVCRCGSDIARVGAPVGPHLAELWCERCRRHRGWLPRAAHQFLVEVVNKFGRPDTPIAIRRNGQCAPAPPPEARVPGIRRHPAP